MAAWVAGKGFANSERYTALDPPLPVEVCIDGTWLPGSVLARNGSRLQVSFEREGSRYRRWVDADVTRPVPAPE